MENLSLPNTLSIPTIHRNRERLPNYSESIRDSWTGSCQSLTSDSKSDMNSDCCSCCDLPVVATDFNSTYDKNGNKFQNKKAIEQKILLPSLTENEIRKAVSEHRGKDFKCDELLDIQMSSMLRYQLKTTFEKTTTATVTEPYNGQDLKETDGTVITCDCCSGKGYTYCTECLGGGVLACEGCCGYGEECEDCGETGVAACGECDGEMRSPCEECDEKGKICCFTVKKTKKETKVNDAYAETIENFPVAFLASCTGEQLSERISSSEYLSPLSYDECLNSKIVQASCDFLTFHQKLERSNCLLVDQRDRICALPIFKITYIRKKETKYLWIVGTNKKVYDPLSKSSKCCIC